MPAIDFCERVCFDADRPSRQILVDTPNMRCVLFCLEAGQEVPTHGTDADVLFLTVQGTGVARVGEERIDLRPGVLVRCPPGEPHGLQGTESLVVVAVVAPRPW